MTTTDDGLPDGLARFCLDDWSHPADAAGVEEVWRSHTGTSMPLEEMRAAFLRVRAFRRFTDARTAWADERGMTLRDLPRLADPSVVEDVKGTR